MRPGFGLIIINISRPSSLCLVFPTKIVVSKEKKPHAASLLDAGADENQRINWMWPYDDNNSSNKRCRGSHGTHI